MPLAPLRVWSEAVVVADMICAALVTDAYVPSVAIPLNSMSAMSRSADGSLGVRPFDLTSQIYTASQPSDEIASFVLIGQEK